MREPLPAADAWYVVIAMGLDGRDLSPVYGEHPYLKLQIGDILARSFSSVPIPIDMSGALIPRVFRVYPYAVTNPVFVDIDGNGVFDAPHETPAWAEGGMTLAKHQVPLTTGRIGVSPLGSSADIQNAKVRQLRYFLGILQHIAGPSGGN